MKTRGIPAEVISDYQRIWTVIVGVYSIPNPALGGAVAVDGVCKLNIHWRATNILGNE
jgi:hypothetical protein